MKKITNQDPESKSPDIIADNIEQLKVIFPEAFIEGKIDFEVLKQLLGGAIDQKEEKYGLNWHGKRNARLLALTPSTGTLRPCPEESVDWDDTQNLFIEGDNLEVLKLLQKSYAGKVKLIYIDPPYNTGNDFVYYDDFQDNIKNYLEITGQVEGENKLSSNTETSGRYHANWLNMMYPRLRLARNLLKEDGVIFISIDEMELSNLRKICDDIFGEENYLNTFCWLNNLKGRQISNVGAARTYELILCYSKYIDKSPQFEGDVEFLKSTMPNSYKGFVYEVEKDDLGSYVIKNELYNTNSAFNEATRPNLVFNIHYNFDTEEILFTDVNNEVEFQGFHIIRPKKNNDGIHHFHAWRWSKEKILCDKRDLKFEITENGCKVYTKIRDYLITNIKDFISDISTTVGTNEVIELFDGKKVFDYPKPTTLIKILISITKNDDVILDFFAGSATTAHAVMKQNTNDKGNRRCILIQLPETCSIDSEAFKNGYVNVADIGKERLRRAGNKLKEENPMFSGDVGFRVFKLDSSNIRAWDPKRDNLPVTLEEHAEHLKADRTEQDILFELLLKLGLDLTVPIEEKSIAGKTVYSIGAGTLLVCLATEVSEPEVEPLALGIVDWHTHLAPSGETQVVFRDSAFANDVAKTNVTAILEQHGLENVRSI